MDRSDRRKIKRRRREYIRQEKLSVKRDRQNLKRRIRRERRRRFILFLRGIFSKSRVSKSSETGHRKKRGRFALYFKFWLQERSRDRAERREMRKKYKPMRDHIRKERWKKFRHDLVAFFKNPIPGRKLNKNQRFILQEIKKERRQKRKEYLLGLPGRMTNSVANFWRKRIKGVRAVMQAAGMFIGEFREATSVRDVRRTLFVTLVNSTVFYILAYLVLYYISQYITIFTASFYDIPAVLYSYRIYWPLYTYSTLYTRAALIVIFGTGPIACLVIGVVFYRLYLFLRSKLNYLKVFLIWIIYHSLNLFFGAYIVGVITRTGFIYTSEWLFLSNVFDVEEIVLLIVSVVVLVISGYYGTRQVMMASVSNKVLEPRRRVFYIIFQLLIPWLIGNGALILMNTPNNPDELLLSYVTSILLIVPALSNFNTPTLQNIRIAKMPGKVSVRWIYVVVAILAMVLIRFGLAGGISFV